MSSDETSNWPKITVVTPSLNQGKYIEQCICSVLDQDYPNLEYMIIDGGSTDGSIELIKKYANRITYWISKPDTGQSNAINKGFRRATGELLAWLNSDDFYLPGALKTVAEAYISQPGAPFYFGDGWRVDMQGKFKNVYYPHGPIDFNRTALVQGLNYILQPSTFISHPALLQIGFLDEILLYGMDTDLWARLSILGKPVPIHAAIAASREYPEAQSSKGMFTRLEELRRVAEKHSDIPATPGYFCYFFDTMHRFISHYPDVYPLAYIQKIEELWESTSKIMAAFGAHPDGNPLNLHRIGVEMRDIYFGLSGGIAQYIEGLLENAFRLYPDYEFYIFRTIFNQQFFPKAPINVKSLTLPISKFDQEVDRILREENIGVLFRSYPNMLNLEYPLRRQVFFIPDVQHDEYPEFFSPPVLEARRLAFRQAMQGAGAIGTLSDFSRGTILQHPENRCQDVFVMAPAVNQCDTQYSEELLPDEKGFLPQDPFFYFPGNLWPHKNHRRTFQAFGLFLEQSNRPMEMILTGHSEGWQAIKNEFPNLPVRHLGFVRPPVLHFLYIHAVAVVFFSLYEGFGIPLLEAFEAGTPVICSNTTSLPEIGGDAVLSCDPADISAMSRLMIRISQEKDLRELLVERGKTRLSKYSWEKSAQDFMSAVQRVAGESETLRDRNQKPLPIRPPLPLVSIVTPSYNQSQFLRRTIESVLDQSYPEIEYVVIDGGSTDESVEILKSYGDRLSWISEVDRGQYDAVNKGFARSRGEILGFLNSDDTLMPDAIETVVHYFQDHPKVDMVYGRAYYINEIDKITGIYNTDDYSLDRLVWDNCVCQPAAFWRKDIASRVGEFDASLHLAGDFDYWLRIHRAGGKIVHLHEVLACSRIYPETKTISLQEESIKESILVSKRHVGRVSINYFVGLWHYRVWTKLDSPYRFLRHIPHSFTIIAKTHQAIFHHKFPDKYKPINLFRRLVRIIRQVATEEFVILNRLDWQIRSSNHFVSPKRIVFGFSNDNWLEPVFQVYIRYKEAGTSLYLSGVPCRNTRLHVKVEGCRVLSMQLLADQPIRIPVEAKQGDRVIFFFQDAARCTADQNRIFLVQDTNLFTGQDVT